MATEKIKFKLELYSTRWGSPPIADVKINDTSYFKDFVKGDEAVPKVIEFEHELEEGKDYKLIIDRSNKRVNDTIVNEKGDITHDQLLHIKSIMIDEIDIGGLVYEGVYKPIYPEQWSKQQKEKGVEFPETLKNVTQMGHNGTWTFNFSSPFYMWLLENLY
jgi:hypothetical protein